MDVCQRLTEEGGPPETHFSCCHRQTFLEVGMKSFTTLRSAKMCVPQTVSALGYVPKRWQIRQLESQSPLKKFFSSEFASQAPWDFETLEELTPMKDFWKKNRFPAGRAHPRHRPVVLLFSAVEVKSSAPQPPLCAPRFLVLHLGEEGCVIPKSVMVEATCDSYTHASDPACPAHYDSFSVARLFLLRVRGWSSDPALARQDGSGSIWCCPCKLRILEKREPHDNLIDEQDAVFSGFLEGSWQFLAFSSPFLLFSNVQSHGSDSP